MLWGLFGNLIFAIIARMLKPLHWNFFCLTPTVKVGYFAVFVKNIQKNRKNS